MARGYTSRDSLERTFVFIEIDGETFDWWEDYSVTHHLLAGCATFQMHAPALPRDDEGRGNQQPDLDARGLKRGQRIKVYVKTPKSDRPVLVLTGYIDDVELSEGRDGAKVTVTGRCHLSPIVDSDVPASLGLENVSLATAIKRVLTTKLPGQPTAFFKESDLLIDNDAGRVLATGKPSAGTVLSANAPKDLDQYKVDQIKPHPGETIYAFLTRHAQRFGLLVWGTPDGKIVFGRPNYNQKALYELRLRQGLRGAENNCDLRRHTSFKHRPSEIHVYGHSHGGDHMRSKIHAIAYDTEVAEAGLWRMLTVHDNNARTKEQAEQRAKFEMSQRRQTGDVLHAHLEGHGGDDGAIYAIDTLASVQWDKGALFEDRYVVGRTLHCDKFRGTHCEMELVPKGSIALGTAT